jgi:hypothetical protein
VRSALVAAVAVLSVLLAGCGTGPSQAGTAAIVGDTAISLERVQDWWQRVVSDDAIKEQLRDRGQFDDLGRVIVRETARHELLRQAAAREGLRFDEAQVSELISTLGGEQAAVEALGPIVYDASTIRDRARDQLLAVDLGRRFFNTTVTFDVTTAKSREQALAKARELAAADADEARSIIETAGRSGAQAAVNQRQSIGDNIDFALSTPLFAVPAGHVLAFPNPDQASQGQWFVTVVRERDTSGSSSRQQGSTTADQVDESRLEGVGLKMLGLYSREIGVRLNPRYGVWSNEYVAAVATDGEVPAIVLPMAHPAS